MDSSKNVKELMYAVDSMGEEDSSRRRLKWSKKDS